MEIKKILQSEKADAMQMVWNVFLEYEAFNYTNEGIQTFRNFIHNEEVINGFEIYGAYEKGCIIGIIATRNEGSHIALFFVDGKYHNQGIGRKLFERILKNSTSAFITVNSSSYAKEVYHKLGFVDTDVEQIKEGMRFTPMTYRK